MPDGTGYAGETTTWRVGGMDCASCAAKVERAVSRLPGVQDIQVNLMAETLTARLAAGSDPASVADTVDALGYTATLRQGPDAVPPAAAHGHSGHGHGPHRHDDAGASPWRTGKARLTWRLAALVAAAYAASLLVPAAGAWLFAAATLAALLPFARRAWALARAGAPFSIETLMTVAALGAVAIGASEEAAAVVLLFALGEMLEGVAAGQARSGIKALADLMPRTARVERGGAAVDLPVDRLALGDIVQARPGDRIPCDGVIVEGQSAVDESPVTGESVPAARGPGDPVMAGSVNTAALLRVRVTATAADNTLGQGYEADQANGPAARRRSASSSSSAPGGRRARWRCPRWSSWSRRCCSAAPGRCGCTAAWPCC